MFEKIKTLSLQTLIYGSGHILARLVTFLLLPLYTNVFTPAEYGIISLAYTFLGFMAVVLHYGLDAALMKRYIPAKGKERKAILATAYVSFLISSIGFVLIIFLLRGFIDEILLGVSAPRYVGYIAVILFFDVLWSTPMLLLRSEERPVKFIILSLLNVCLTMGFNLVFILKYEMGVQGVLLSNIISSGVLFLTTLPITLKRLWGGHISVVLWKSLMKFGLPFLPSGIFAMLMELADRYLLKIFTDMQTVGLYSAGYKLGMLMMLAVMGFNMGWQPFFLREGDSDNKRQLYARIATYVLAVLGFFWVIMLLWVDNLIRLPLGSTTLYGVEYWPSANIVPWIALGYLFHAAYLLQLPGVFLLEKSKWIAISRGIGALSNIGLNLILIPLYGAMGAATATCASFFIMAVVIYIVNRRIYPIQYEWGRLLRIASLISIIAVFSTNFSNTWINDLCLTIVYPLGLLGLRFFNKQELERLKTLILP